MARPTPRPTVDVLHVPAPMGGLNKSTAGNLIPETDCIALYNMVASAHGLRVRSGYREWVTGITGATTNQVRSVLPFTGSTIGNAKLFACSDNKIWDCSASSAAPSSVLAFGSATGDAGYGVCAGVVTSAGHKLVYCDEVNGYHLYDEGGSWAAVTMGGGGSQISGADPATFVFPFLHKNRLWFVKRDSASAYYLATGAVYGAATEFNFGRQFRNGGYLVGLWSFTYDGGHGLDDSLVAISSGGDVVIYQGTDPAAVATWSVQGTWQVGGVVGGRRIATERGGDILIATSLGLMPLSQLVTGKTGDDSEVYETRKLGPYFGQQAASFGSLRDWGLYTHPTDNTLILAVPSASGAATNQLAMSLATKAWCQYADLPLFSAAAWQRDLYFGTTDGRVCKNTGAVDDVLLSDGSNMPIEWRVFTAFSDLGKPFNKQLQGIRPVVLSGQTVPLAAVEARYDYDLSEPAAPSGSPTQTGPVWDTAVWDTDVWGGDYTASNQEFGAVGMGRHVAIAARGKSVTETVLVGFDVSYTAGGPE
jgi:hypothetical protein